MYNVHTVTVQNVNNCLHCYLLHECITWTGHQLKSHQIHCQW